METLASDRSSGCRFSNLPTSAGFWDALREDYHVTLAVIGEKRLRTLVAAQLTAHPSDSPFALWSR